MNTQKFDEKNLAIKASIEANRLALFKKHHDMPIVGDVVRWIDGSLRRVCHRWSDSIGPNREGETFAEYQTSKTGRGSYFAFDSGHASYSGTLEPPARGEFFVLTQDIVEQEFWFFSHGLAGAGRGVYCNLPCRVWELKPFTLTREEAEKHPQALRAKEFWQTNQTQIDEVIEKIMNPRLV